METEFLGPDRDELVIAHLLLGERGWSHVSKLTFKGYWTVSETEHGDHLIKFTHPSDLAHAAIELAYIWRS